NRKFFFNKVGAVLLFVVFWLPQANNALHYFVVEHHFEVLDSNTKQFHHNHKTHDCEQSIYKLPFTYLFDFGYSELTKYVIFSEIETSLYKVFYKSIFFENIQNKGPPVVFHS